jgi:DNA-directed RNA polymerase specialized sigma24 family protein
MKSRTRKVFDLWFAEAYDALVEAARGMHREPRDLVHHVYLACINAEPPNIMDNPAGYFHTAMWIQSTRGGFKHLYTIFDAPLREVVSVDDISSQIAREEAMLLTRHLAWFDRTVLTLYLEGYNLRQVSRESGIPHTTLYQSLYRTRKKLRDAIGKQ